MSKLWEVEDYLQNSGCFVSGINGRETLMESYMTVLSFDKLEAALKVAPFTPDELLQASDEMISNGYLSPINTLTGRWIQRTLNKRMVSA